MARKPLSERVIGDLSSGNLDHHGRGEIRPVDRIGALAEASDLGRAIRRLQATARTDASRHVVLRSEHISMTCVALREAAEQLSNSKARALNSISDLERLCLVTVYQMNQAKCPICKGTRSRTVDHQVIDCNGCNGSGVRWYTDGDQARIFGRPLEPRHADVRDELMSLYTHHSVLADSTIREQLEDE